MDASKKMSNREVQSQNCRVWIISREAVVSI
jgi:hypothetical protein